MPPILQGFIFLFGTIIGSFLNAYIYRLRTQEGIVSGRSYCPCCKTTLQPWDLVPVLSYLFLRGKCRYCRKSIHKQYIIVELVTGLFFLLAAMTVIGVGPLSQLAFMKILFLWYVIAILMIVFVYDLRYMLILPSVTVPATLLAAIANYALGIEWQMIVLAMVIGGGFFLLQRIVSRGKWVGGGDVYLGFLMGAILGFPMILVALFIAYVLGAVSGLLLMLTRRAKWRSEIPFGTFLSFATILTLLWGSNILDWYIGLL